MFMQRNGIFVRIIAYTLSSGTPYGKNSIRWLYWKKMINWFVVMIVYVDVMVIYSNFFISYSCVHTWFYRAIVTRICGYINVFQRSGNITTSTTKSSGTALRWWDQIADWRTLAICKARAIGWTLFLTKIRLWIRFWTEVRMWAVNMPTEALVGKFQIIWKWLLRWSKFLCFCEIIATFRNRKGLLLS